MISTSVLEGTPGHTGEIHSSINYFSSAKVSKRGWKTTSGTYMTKAIADRDGFYRITNIYE